MTAALRLLRSFRQQNLLIEFAALKRVQLQGIYLSLTPRNHTLWTGTLFVRRGVYARAVLRFRVSFPSNYPFALPVITFTSDIFHPLVTPLTSYTHAAPTDRELMSGDSDEPLPPGSFSLRYGFPEWFGSRSRSADLSSPKQADFQHPEATSREADAAANDVHLNVVDILRHMRLCFEDDATLDSIPFEAAVNPSAWYAWQSHRGRDVKKTPVQLQSAASVTAESSRTSDATPARAKQPSEWNWEGVWADRVKKAVQNSVTEQVLFGTAVIKDDDIHFLDVDEEISEKIRAQMRTQLASTQL